MRSNKKSIKNTQLKKHLLHVHKFYNLSRYLFLNIEWNYNKYVEKNNITLPQLRVLWITALFPGVSLVEIAEIAGWSPPTVSKILRNLIKKELITNKENQNKKSYNLYVTEKGYKCIEDNQIYKGEEFPIFELQNHMSNLELDFLNSLFEEVVINMNKKLVLKYIERMNLRNYKIHIEDFDKEDRDLIHKLIYFYNCLRIIVLNIESIHRDMLKPLDLTYPQLRCLWIIEAFPGITSVELSKIAYVSPSTANVIVKNIYKKGLIRKEKSVYKNSLFLYITEAGKQLIKEDFNVSQVYLNIYKSIEIIDENKMIKANEILEKMNQILKNQIVDEYLEKTSLIISKLLM